MYLKRLESVGFKSFAERVKVEFVPGVTAIIGPNGSGKSNITDAIKWVLGEQSVKSLRGSKMEDIIFQGSDTRKPLNVAEVTLILDNSDQTLPIDYDEVSVTRRVYRSGESEFYINKQSCRLRDIIELFMDSGLGREAFSIISQGKVEEVLSSKAEERRIIFEEAAGVLKYKQRKEKAQFKLAETKENLSRVDDIIYEIEQQIDPLYEQSQIAEQYIKLTEQLKEKEISVLITEIEQLHNKWQQLKSAVEEGKIEEIEIKSYIQKREASLESKRQLIQSIDDEIDHLQSTLLTTTQQLEQYEGKRKVWSERTKHFSENKHKLEQQKKHLSNSIENLTTQLTEENRKLKYFQTTIKETNHKINQLQNHLTGGIESIQEKIEEQKAEYIEILNKQAAKRNEQQTIQQQLKKISKQNELHVDKYQQLLTTQKELENERETILLELTQLKEENHKKQINIQHLKKDLDQGRDRYNLAQKKLYKGYQTIAELNSRKDILEEMKDDFQGFFYGVKNILKARDEKILKNIFGAVIELINVPKKYITSIETVLNNQAQHVVVKDDHAAREAIFWLKRTNNGRATFLPLQSIRPRLLTTTLLSKINSHPGFIDIAANLVETEKRFQLVVDHLMGNVVIANNLKDANEIAAILNRRYRIVTLDGDVVNPGGAMSGGAKKNSKQSLFTREKDLEDIKKKLENYQSKIKTFELTLNDQKQALEQMKDEIVQKEQTLQNDQKSLQTIQKKYQNIEMKLFSIRDNISIYKNDQTLYEQDKDDLNERNHKLTKDLQNITQQLTNIQKNIDDLSEEEKEFTQRRESMKNDLHEYQIKLAEQEERKRNQQEKTITINNQLTDLHEQYKTYDAELNELLTIQQSEETKEEIDQKILEKKSVKEELEKQIQQRRSKRLEQTQLIEDEERELKEQHKQHQLMVEKLQQQEVKINRLDVDLENRLTKLQTDYTISFEKARETYQKTDNIQETQFEVNQLKQAIKNLGTVNLGAIDEYKRISDRYEFLTKQKNDLVEAKQTLFAVISEMDEVMKKRFEQTFLQIKKEFSIVFKELFGGGHAELKLTEPQDLLETGIDIIAQPPGKKLQHLGLLSGGERALTAIALLFSILRARPVPFCVLDEVEAALDEVNVVRFAKYVKQHSDETQFIVITHRKGTMEEADVLYGVTMQESGVSRLVSVQLEDTLELVSSS